MDELQRLIEKLEIVPPGEGSIMAKALAALKAVLSWNRISPPDMSDKVHIRYPSLAAQIRRAIRDVEASK